MNKPARPLTPDPAIGPLDGHGQQIWSPEEEAAIARMAARPDHAERAARAEAQIDSGEGFTTAEVRAWMRERKREWFAQRGVAPPPGYFDR